MGYSDAMFPDEIVGFRPDYQISQIDTALGPYHGGLMHSGYPTPTFYTSEEALRQGDGYYSHGTFSAGSYNPVLQVSYPPDQYPSSSGYNAANDTYPSGNDYPQHGTGYGYNSGFGQ